MEDLIQDERDCVRVNVCVVIGELLRLNQSNNEEKTCRFRTKEAELEGMEVDELGGGI